MSVTEEQLGLRGREASGDPGVPLQPRTWMRSYVPAILGQEVPGASPGNPHRLLAPLDRG